MTWKNWGDHPIIVAITLILGLYQVVSGIYDRYLYQDTIDTLRLNCPIRLGDAETTETFKKTVFDLWARIQKREIGALTAWQETFDDLVSEINRKEPRTNGSLTKARALHCLEVMSQTGDFETKTALQNFDDANKAMNQANWYWVVDKKIDGDKVKRPESFEIWRENLYARAETGDLKAQSDINFLESLDIGIALSNEAIPTEQENQQKH